MDRDRDGIEAQHESVFQPHTSHTEHPRTHSRAAPTITPVAAGNDAESSNLSMMMANAARADGDYIPRIRLQINITWPIK